MECGGFLYAGHSHHILLGKDACLQQCMNLVIYDRFFSILNQISNQSKSNLSLYLLHYAETCNELAGPISASLRPSNTASFEEMSQRWRAVGNTVSNLTGSRFEPQTSRSRDERVTARPTGRFFCIFII